MSRSKVAVSLEETTLDRLDRLVERSVFPSRSQAIQIAIEEKLDRIERSRLARECAKLDRDFEKSLAEEGMSEDLSAWPAYREEKFAGPISIRYAAGNRLDCVRYSS